MGGQGVGSTFWSGKRTRYRLSRARQIAALLRNTEFRETGAAPESRKKGASGRYEPPERPPVPILCLLAFHQRLFKWPR